MAADGTWNLTMNTPMGERTQHADALDRGWQR